MNAIRKAEQEGRLIFFRDGKYKYIPTKETQEKMARYKKPFDSEKAHKAHQSKLIFRNSIKEANRKIELIESQLEKGKKVVKIVNKEYICK